jgi:hypothetical protein
MTNAVSKLLAEALERAKTEKVYIDLCLNNNDSLKLSIWINDKEVGYVCMYKDQVENLIISLQRVFKGMK